MTPCFAPHKLQNTDPSAILPPHWLQNRESPPIRTGDVGPILLNHSALSVRTATLVRVCDPRDHPQIARHAVPRSANAEPHGTPQRFLTKTFHLRPHDLANLSFLYFA